MCEVEGEAAAAARDLYTSPLFAKRRAYAEDRGCPWFVLSARHGLLSPGEVIEPYDVALKEQSPAYRRAWGEWTVARLELELGRLAGRAVEVHAGSAYAEAVRDPLERAGATVITPLAWLRQGEQLAWYSDDPPYSYDRQYSEDPSPSGDSCAPSSELDVVGGPVAVGPFAYRSRTRCGSSTPGGRSG